MGTYQSGFVSCAQAFRLFSRLRVKDMFYHAYNGYLEHAYPYDELRPITCDGHDTWGR